MSDDIGSHVDRLIELGVPPGEAARIIADVFRAGVLASAFRGDAPRASSQRKRERDAARMREKRAAMRDTDDSRGDVAHVAATQATQARNSDAARAEPLTSNLQENSYQKPPLKGGQKGKVLCRVSDADFAAGQMAKSALEAESFADHAASMHAQAISILRDAGFSVSAEVTTSIGDDRHGRIDIVASRDGGRVGIELDSRRARRKSILKLHNFFGFRLICLRGVDATECPDGIDAVARLDVRQATAEERSDRRVVNRGTRLPADWMPTAEQRSVAEGMGFSPSQATVEFDRFRDYWIAKPGQAGVKTDWAATLRNWLRSSAERKGLNVSGASGATGPPVMTVPEGLTIEERNRWLADYQRKQKAAQAHEGGRVRAGGAGGAARHAEKPGRDEGLFPDFGNA